MKKPYLTPSKKGKPYSNITNQRVQKKIPGRELWKVAGLQLKVGEQDPYFAWQLSVTD